jgi:acetoacetate decarboxylase
MTEDEVRRRVFAMPLTSRAFPPGPYRFVNREIGQVLPVREQGTDGGYVHAMFLDDESSDLTLGLGTVIHDYLA